MKILLATDGSEFSEGAARFLTCLDLTQDDEIMVIHVLNWIPFRYDMESYYESLKEIKREIAPRILDSAIDIIKTIKSKISTTIIDGSAEKYIVDVASESGMDMIVMGARGIKGIKSFLIGSVTKAVAVRSSVPVFVAKPPVCRPAGRFSILFASDGSEHSAAVGRYLSVAPFPVDTEIHVLNVIWSDFSDIPERFVLEINDRIRDAVAQTRSMEFKESEKILDQACTPLRKKYRNIKTLSKFGDPPTEIMKAADELGVNVIAIGCKGPKGTKGMMGSVTRNLLAHSKCSLLISTSCAQ